MEVLKLPTWEGDRVFLEMLLSGEETGEAAQASSPFLPVCPGGRSRAGNMDSMGAGVSGGFPP